MHLSAEKQFVRKNHLEMILSDYLVDAPVKRRHSRKGFSRCEQGTGIRTIMSDCNRRFLLSRDDK